VKKTRRASSYPGSSGAITLPSRSARRLEIGESDAVLTCIPLLGEQMVASASRSASASPTAIHHHMSRHLNNLQPRSPDPWTALPPEEQAKNRRHEGQANLRDTPDVGAPSKADSLTAADRRISGAGGSTGSTGGEPVPVVQQRLVVGPVASAALDLWRVEDPLRDGRRFRSATQCERPARFPPRAGFGHVQSCAGARSAPPRPCICGRPPPPPIVLASVQCATAAAPTTTGVRIVRARLFGT
jgi:hypothetical protein